MTESDRAGATPPTDKEKQTMLTAVQEEKIREAIRAAKSNYDSYKDAYNRAYYGGQFDGIYQVLEILGIEINE